MDCWPGSQLGVVALWYHLIFLCIEDLQGVLYLQWICCFKSVINFCSIIRRTTVRNLRIREDTAKVCDSTICCVSMFLLLLLLLFKQSFQTSLILIFFCVVFCINQRQKKNENQSCLNNFKSRKIVIKRKICITTYSCCN